MNLLIQVMQLEVEILLCVYNSVRPKLTKAFCTCYRFDWEIKQDKCVTEEENSNNEVNEMVNAKMIFDHFWMNKDMQLMLCFADVCL